jgi:hypothetical protein
LFACAMSNLWANFNNPLTQDVEIVMPAMK